MLLRVLSRTGLLAVPATVLCAAGLHAQAASAAATARTPAAAAPTSAAPRPAAPTPPMGWNSWDAYGLTIVEPAFRANVEVLHRELQPLGYSYAVIDEGWFFYNPEARSTPDKLEYALDANGRYVPVPARFASALGAGRAAAAVQSRPGTLLASRTETTSFAPLAAWVHAQGLQFGIHIVRGIPRAAVERNTPIAGSDFHAKQAADVADACPWDPTNWGVQNNAAGQAWYDSLLAQYAAWGIDLLKVDCIADHPYKADEIVMIHRAIAKAEARTGRRIVLSLSPGPTQLVHAAEVERLADMWRIADDVWDVWDSKASFPTPIPDMMRAAAAWHALPPVPGRWPDLDMLPLGELRPSPGWGDARASRLTPDEQRFVVTLWAIAQSPLIVGGNLTLLDAPTRALLTNREVLRIDQQRAPVGHAIDVANAGELRVWAAPVVLDGRSRVAVALFNLGAAPLVVDRSLAELTQGRPMPRAAVRDVWTGRDMGRLRRVQVTLPPHGSMLLTLELR